MNYGKLLKEYFSYFVELYTIVYKRANDLLIQMTIA